MPDMQIWEYRSVITYQVEAAVASMKDEGWELVLKKPTPADKDTPASLLQLFFKRSRPGRVRRSPSRMSNSN